MVRISYSGTAVHTLVYLENVKHGGAQAENQSLFSPLVEYSEQRLLCKKKKRDCVGSGGGALF